MSSKIKKLFLKEVHILFINSLKSRQTTHLEGSKLPILGPPPGPLAHPVLFHRIMHLASSSKAP